jgi:hypothetical protein
MISLFEFGRLQGGDGALGMGTVATSLWAVDANGSAHAAATKDAVMKRIANALASFFER